MKKIIFVLAIVCTVFFSVSFVKAAPMQWGMALNLETKECAGFWPGDEFVAYDLPEGWKSYFPKYDPETKITTLETEIGSCDFKMKGDEEKCCEQLGYHYVSDNIGKGQKTVLRDREAFEKQLKWQREKPRLIRAISLIAVTIAIVGIILLIIWLVRKKKNGPKG